MRKTSLVLAMLLAVAGICVMLWPVFTGYRLQADTDAAVQSFLEERKPEQQYLRTAGGSTGVQPPALRRKAV